jgi:hypothetical protein
VVDALSWSRMLGMRLTQAAAPSPLSRNTTKIALRHALA